MSRPLNESDLREAFAQFDKDGDGALNKEELRRAIGNALTEEDLDELIADFDANGDGVLQVEEMVVAWAALGIEVPAQGSLASSQRPGDIAKAMATDMKDETASKQRHDAMKAAVASSSADDLEEIALDGDGAPPPTPAAAPQAPVLPAAKREALAAKFREADADGNGQLSKAEIGELLLLEAGDATLEELWKVADKDGDGKVTFEEFCGAADALESVEAKLDADMADDLGL